jgi:hypothetical protein
MHPLFNSIGAPDVPSHVAATFQSNPSPKSCPRTTSSRILNTWKRSLSPCRRTRSRTGTPSTSACHRWSSRARRSEPPFFMRLSGLTDGREIASDDEFTLFGVVVFRRVHDEFQQKCRENKYARESVPCPCTTLTPSAKVHRARLRVDRRRPHEAEGRALDRQHNRKGALGARHYHYVPACADADMRDRPSSSGSRAPTSRRHSRCSYT